MRHRSPRPLLGIWRWRPPVPGFVRRFGTAGRTRARLVVALAVALGIVVGLVVTASEIGDGTPRTEVATSRPGEMRSGPAVSRDGGRTPLPQSSSPDEPTPTPTPSSAAEAQAQPGPREVSRWATRAPDEAASPSPTEQPSSLSTEPSTEPSKSSTTAPANDISPETSGSTSSSSAEAWVVAFTANEPSSFECSLDGGAFESCASTMEYTGLDPGRHTFSVRATDAAGNLDESPANLRRHPTGKKSMAN